MIQVVWTLFLVNQSNVDMALIHNGFGDIVDKNDILCAGNHMFQNAIIKEYVTGPAKIGHVGT